MRPAAGIRRPAFGLGLIGLLSFVVGVLGQGSWGIGARAAPSAVSVAVTDVTGGAGNRRPVRAQLSLTITNLGTDEVSVLPPLTAGNGARVLGLQPPAPVVKPRTIAVVDADVALDCDATQPLQLPDLQLLMIDGVRRSVEIGDSGRILEACSRAVSAVRPLAVELGPIAKDDSRPGQDRRRSIVLSSPTGRRIDVTAVRSGGVTLLTPPKPVTVTGSARVVVQLTAPATCPVQWRVAGIPSSLSVDLAPGSDAGATLRLRLGPPLTTWLLATSCPRSP